MQLHLPIYPFFAMSHYHQHDQSIFLYAELCQLQNKMVETRYSIISKHLSPQSNQIGFYQYTIAVFQSVICRMKL